MWIQCRTLSGLTPIILATCGGDTPNAAGQGFWGSPYFGKLDMGSDETPPPSGGGLCAGQGKVSVSYDMNRRTTNSRIDRTRITAGATIMIAQQIVLHGQVRPDGTLQVEEKVGLPPGPVSVTVQTVVSGHRKGTLQVLEEIWAERAARGMVARSKEEVDAEINAMREEDEARMRDIDAIEQCPQGRKG